MEKAAARLFINYRIEDSGPTASRLFNELQRELAPNQVFIDHERIEGGEKWPDRLRSEVRSASIMFCLVGKRWLTAQDPETGDRRLNMPEDWVRCEIEAAIDKATLVVPVLIDDTPPLPKRAFQTLPGLAQLVELQCLRLRTRDWSADLQGLLTFLVERGFERTGSLIAPNEGHAKYAEAIQQYRQRLSGLYDRWDLSSVGITQSGGAPLEVRLDDIYLPLRLSKTGGPSETNAGTTYSPLALLARDKPLVVRGVGGSGKTTWVRWTFRRLLDDEGAFPICVELRRLAASWGKPGNPSQGRSIEGYLEALLVEYSGAEWKDILGDFLAGGESEPRPVLFVDGWDELGPLGEEVRFKLVRFCNDYPRTLIVVTSRPYGEGRPSDSDGFEVLDIQPLAADEIEFFARRFYDRCWGEDQVAAETYTKQFLTSLERSPEAASLARTMLLLTMMLFISRVKQLPDKRHLLYQTCVEHLLTTLPERKREEGVLIVPQQWRPTDSEETLRVTALLAFRMQSSGFRDRSPIVASRDQAKEILPDNWRNEQRERFLNWLVGSAGLLIDRSDDTLSFAHLSFQEFLAAWHLHATIEGAEERSQTCLAKLEERTWWETLRLWTALVGGQKPEKVSPILEGLFASEAGLCLAGTMLADGVGSKQLFVEWSSRYVNTIRDHLPADYDLVNRAWVASRQDHRRDGIVEVLNQQAQDTTWLEWVRFRNLAKSIASGLQLNLPRRETNARALIEASYGRLETARQVALGRLLSTGSPLWPGEPRELMLLQAWPGPRRLVGHRLQLLASLGANRADLAGALLLDSFPEDINLRVPRAALSSERTAHAAWLGLDLATGKSAADAFFFDTLTRLDTDFEAVLTELVLPSGTDRIDIEAAEKFLTLRNRPFHADLVGKLIELKVDETSPVEAMMAAIRFCEDLEPALADTLFEWLRVTSKIIRHPTPLDFLNRLTEVTNHIFYDMDLTSEEEDFSWDWICDVVRGSLSPLVDLSDEWGDLYEENLEPFLANIVNSKCFNKDYRGVEWARECAARWLESTARLPDAPRRIEGRGIETLVDLRSALGTLAYGAAGFRAMLAHFEPSRAPGITRLLALACRVSLHPQFRPGDLKRALMLYPDGSDPLWAALARHIARWSTDQDRCLLIDLARRPERREGVLRWGLQYVVRGDVILDDGTEVTLDDLAEQAGVKPLPYIVDVVTDGLWRRE
jgi:hypothetical protein